MVATTKIARSGSAVRSALTDLSPEEAHLFEREFHEALSRAAATFDLAEAETVLTRWWGIANLRANPLTDHEQHLIARLHAGEDVGWSSPADRRQSPQAQPS